MQCLQHREALSHAQRTVVRQHDTSAAHTYSCCSGCHVGDHDLGEHAHQPFVVVMFGKPVAAVPCLLRQDGYLGGVVQHPARRAVVLGEVGQVKYREFHFLHLVQFFFCIIITSCSL